MKEEKIKTCEHCNKETTLGKRTCIHCKKHIHGWHHEAKTIKTLRVKNLGAKNPAYGKPAHNKGIPCPEDQKRKISIANTGNVWSDAARAAASKTHKGKKLAEEHRNNIRKSKKGEKNPMFGKTGENCPFYGHKHTKQRKQQMSDDWPKTHSKDGKKGWSTEIALANAVPKWLPFEKNPPRKYNPDLYFPLEKNWYTKVATWLRSQFVKSPVTKEGKPSRGLYVYADGDYHHGLNYLRGYDFSKYERNNEYFEEKIRKDKHITKELKNDGFVALRFWEHKIKNDPKKCVQKIIVEKLNAEYPARRAIMHLLEKIGLCEPSNYLSHWVI